MASPNPVSWGSVKLTIANPSTVLSPAEIRRPSIREAREPSSTIWRTALSAWLGPLVLGRAPGSESPSMTAGRMISGRLDVGSIRKGPAPGIAKSITFGTVAPPTTSRA
jgi:hypothetical protein